MDSVKYILGLPEVVDDIEIYPVRIKDYDEFMGVVNALVYSKEHLIGSLMKQGYVQDDKQFKDVELLDMLMQFNTEDLSFIDMLVKAFTIVSKQEIEFVFDEESNYYGFKIDKHRYIDRYNYDKIRKIILKQNIIFEPKVYKYEATQKLAEKILKARAKNSLNTTIEDMISTIVVRSSLSFKDLMDCTIYQVQHLFRRILSFESYRRDTLFQTVDSEGKIRPEHFAEEIVFNDPYSDLFKNKSQFTNLKQAGFDLNKI